MSNDRISAQKRVLLAEKLKNKTATIKSFPLSFGQERLWFVDQIDPETATYNSAFAVRMAGTLDVAVLRKSISEIVRRHDILRTIYARVKGRSIQVVVPTLPLPLPVIDLRTLPEDLRDSKILHLAHTEQMRPFDLARGPVLRVSLLHVSNDKYLFLMVVHHIAFDGWSLGIFVHELTTLYTAFLAGRPSPLPSLPIQFADFAVWQRKWMQGEVLERHLSYWKEQLADAPSLNLPTDHPRPPVLSSRGSAYPVALSRTLVQEFQNLSQYEGVTLFMTLLAAFQTLLFRYTGQEDLLVATLIANRNRTEIEPMIGFVANAIILRTNLSGNPTFRELIARVREVTLNAYSHQDLPFDRLVESLLPDRNLSRSPLYQVGFALQNTPLPIVQLPDLTLSFLQQDQVKRTAKAELSMILEEIEGDIMGEVEYSTDLFDRETIIRLTDHWQILLKGIIANPDQHISDLPLLPPTEQQQIVHTWNATQRAYPQNLCVHTLFELQAARSPKAVAVTSGHGKLTYEELDRRSNQLAHCLQEAGLKAGDYVGICMERSLEMIVGLLGILKAGGTYVPLDPTYPAERLAFMLEDAHISVLLSQPALLSTLPIHNTQVICLDTTWQTISHASDQELSVHITPDYPAYIIYTSGSTGKPKGVCISHQAIKRLVCNMDYLQIGAGDHVAQVSNSSFDAATFEIWGALLNGAHLVSIAKDITLSPQDFVTQIREQKISALFLTTALFNQVVKEIPSAFKTVRHVLFGGEAADPRRVKEVLRAEPPEHLLHVYGPTECTTFATWYPVENVADDANTVPIGRPITNTQAYILDQHLHAVPTGIYGELYLGGDGLASGYLGRLALTAEKFIPDPFSGLPGARLYKTGDLVRYLSDGAIEFKGRIDQQIKLRGFRIELGEIEAALVQHPEVQGCAVIVREEAVGDRRIVAYVVPEGSSPHIGTLRSFLQDKLPAYMIPAAFVMMEVLPLTPNGKVNHQLLPAPDMLRPDLEEAFSAPRTPTEKILAEIWSQTLGIDQVGIHDNFFSLGGDSILSIQIIARAKQASLHLKPLQLFQYQTIAELAAVASIDATTQHEQENITGSVPVTPIQQWFLTQNRLRPQHWNQAVFLEMLQQPDINALKRALQALLKHHDALRLRYSKKGTTWQQTNADFDAAEEIPFSHYMLSGLSSIEQELLLASKTDEVQASLHLEHGPLIHMALFELGADKPARLLLSIHHLVVDGVSWRILLEDLHTAYQQLLRGQAVELPLKTTSFKEWATRLKHYAQSPALTQEAGYWQCLFQHELSALPVDHANGANTELSSATIVSELSLDETKALLQDVPETYHTQINDVLLTALIQTFRKWTGKQTLHLDLEGHGREDLFADVDLSRTVGWFTSIFPVILHLQDTHTPGDALKSIKEQLRGVPNRGIGYGLLRYLNEQIELSEQFQVHPQAQISFNYLGQFDQTLPQKLHFRLTGYSTGKASDPQGNRSHLLEIVARVTDGHLRTYWTFSENVYGDPTIEHLAASFDDALRMLIQHCQSPAAGGYTPGDFPLARLTQAQLDALLVHVTRAKDTLMQKQRIACVEDCYALSPMQQGMLFHSQYAPASGVYVEQMVFAIHGDMHKEALMRSWRYVIERHASLRAAFYWDGLEAPVQILCKDVQIPLEVQDWRTISPSAQDSALQTFLKTDQQRGFVLDQAPLMRLTIIRLSDDIHQLVWTFHHLLLDGWCLSQVLGEILTFYEADRQNQKIRLARSRPYRDYIAWLQQQSFTNAEEFWRRKLKNFYAPTPISIRKNSRLQSNLEELHTHEQRTITATTTAKLQEILRSNHLTLNTLIQGAWALLLSHYSGERDIVYGVIVSGRPAELAGVESMIGLFINTLPLRVEVAMGETALVWLQRLQTQLAELRQYEYSPLVQVQSWSEVPRGLPLFESIIVFENYPVHSALHERAHNSLDIRSVDAVEQTNYPLSLIVSPGQELSLRMYYDGNLFAQDDIARMLAHLQIVIEGLATNLQQTIGMLPIVTQEERTQQIVTWNETQTDYPDQLCIHELFERQAVRTPLATAIIYEYERQSYTALNRKSNQYAHYLRSIGVGPEVLIGICMERSIEMVAAMLAVLKVGGAYVPLDPAYPQERLAFILEDAHIDVLLTQQSLATKLPHGEARQLCIDSQAVLFTELSTENLPCLTHPANLAYVIYTSGSTGRPKGVTITHRSAVAMVDWAQKTFTPEQLRGVLASTSICFDLSVFELFVPLSQGGSVILAENALQLPALPMAQEVSLVNTVPSAMAELVRIGGLPASVQVVNLAGEALAEDLVKQIYTQHTIMHVYNLYGPSEDTVYSSYALIARDSDGIPPIGRPIANTQIYLLDTNLQPVPVGIPGEVYIGGSGLARGYYRHPDMTAEKFLPNPFTNTPGARLYKTGDLACYKADGAIEFIGRSDHQVKIRGFRIESGEIEAVLRRHPLLQEVVVVAETDTAAKKRLVAYIVLEEGQIVSVDAVRKFLQKHLPDYMVPSIFMFLETLPHTPNGKIDRRALPAPGIVRPELSETYTPPTTPVEEMLAQIWRDVLGIARVGLYDNFFSLGGDSILSIQIISRARQVGLYLTPKQLFQHQTVAELAASITLNQSVQADQGIVSGPVPLTPIQHWFFSQELPKPHHWNQSVLLELPGTVNELCLKQAIQHLLLKHDALRTRFIYAEGIWSQATTPWKAEEEPPFIHIDLSTVAQDLREQTLLETAYALQASLDLTNGSLIRAAFFSAGQYKAPRLLIIIHHLVVDSISWRILLEDLQTAYEQLCHGKAIALPAKTTAFKQWAKLLQEYARSAEVQQEHAYWSADERMHAERLPVDYVGVNTVASTDTVGVSLDVETTTRLLHEIPAIYRTHINDVLLMALGHALAEWTNGYAFLVDLEGHGREELFAYVDLSRTVGWFTTLFPVSLKIDKAAQLTESLLAVKEQLRSLPHNGIGYGLLNYLAPPNVEQTRSLCDLPPAEVLFNYLGNIDSTLPATSLFKFAAGAVGREYSLQGKRSHLLVINAVVEDGQLQLRWSYSKNLHRRSTIEGVAHSFITVLQTLVADIQTAQDGNDTVSDFPLANLDGNELDKLASLLSEIDVR